MTLTNERFRTRKVVGSPQHIDMEPSVSKRLAHAYLLAKQAVIDAGFESEIDWQNNIDPKMISESLFLREAAWVILSAGMRETVIRKVFPRVSHAFLNWESAGAISKQANYCRAAALPTFNNNKKIDAIIQIAGHVTSEGFDFVLKSVQQKGVDYIVSLPYMGPATSAHFAKNLGIIIVKPDRHLNRVAEKTGFKSPQEMCELISNYVGDNIAEIDLVIWRFATINKRYLEHFDSYL